MLRLKFWNRYSIRFCLDHADPAGQHAAVGTLSPSDCHPAGPAGLYVAGGPVGQDGIFKVLEPLEHSVLDHANPAGQHAGVQDTLEPLEHSVLDTILDCRPMEGITRPEPLEHMVLDTTGLVGHREGAAESRVLQGRDARSVRVPVPDCRGIDQNFHDVTIVPE